MVSKQSGPKKAKHYNAYNIDSQHLASVELQLLYWIVSLKAVKGTSFSD